MTLTFTLVHENKLQLLVKIPRLLGKTLVVLPSEKQLVFPSGLFFHLYPFL